MSKKSAQKCKYLRKLLVPINQSFYLISFCYNFLDRTKETNMYEIKSRRLTDIGLFYFSSVIFKKITEKSNPSEKNVIVRIVEEEPDCINIYNIRNLEDSPRFVFIEKECGDLIVDNN